MAVNCRSVEVPCSRGKGITALRTATEHVVDDAVGSQSSQVGEVSVGGAIQQLTATERFSSRLWPSPRWPNGAL